LERFSDEDSRAVILKHVVERVILDPNLTPFAIQQALSAVANDPLASLDALNPGFRMKGTIEVGDKKLVGDFDSLVENKTDRSVTVSGGKFELRDQASSLLTKGVDKVLIDMRSRGGITAAAAGRLQGFITAKSANTDSGDKVSLSNATVKIGYKARPLNGIWATAPYLHNGSVPNLAELLKSPADRVKSFHVGSKEYDPVHVGYEDDPTQPLFDTTADGNSNAGHDYGGKLSSKERQDLLEYLKSL
jgi:hypothetical protein